MTQDEKDRALRRHAIANLAGTTFAVSILGYLFAGVPGVVATVGLAGAFIIADAVSRRG